ncbi:MAG: FecR domain-containing protein [Rhodanobacter sp.]
MNGVNQGINLQTHALDEAEAWFARRLGGEDADQAEFEQWLAASPAHLAAWERTCALWDRVGEMVDESALADFADEALLPENERIEVGSIPAVHAGRRFARRRFQRAAVVAMAASLVIAAVVFSVASYRPQTYVADANGGDVHLPDGTQVRLDVGARLETEMGWWHRNVRLLQGRAVFDVVHSAWRPFVVDAGAGRITVLGTRFQVDRESDALAVTLVRGSVRIDSPENQLQVQLQPDEQASWSASTGHWTQSKVDAQALTSWVRGYQVFNATPLVQAVAEINRYSQRKMRLADPALGTLELSGSFHLGDVLGVANALPYVLPVKVQTKGNEIIVSRR